MSQTAPLRQGFELFVLQGGKGVSAGIIRVKEMLARG